MLPLDGTLVLDFCHGYPGSYTAMFLGDFGAEVIRIDAPGGSLLGQDDNPERSAAFYTLHRNKKSITLNMKHEAGQEIVHTLARRADVLVEGFRPGVMKRLKADYATLKAINPRLIYCSLSGFGADGPYAGLPAHDMNYVALSGVLSLIGQRDGQPYLPSNLIADMAGAGLNGVIGILLAIIARDKTGQGQLVDIAYLDSVVSLLSMEAPNYFLSGKVPERGKTPFTGAAPWANVYKCRDGEYITLGCFEPHLWENLCRALGREDLIPLQNPPPAEADEAIASLAEVFLTRTRDEWSEFFQDKNTCVSPVNYLNETFADPQVLHRNMLVEKEHPTIGKVQQVGIPIKLSDTPGEIRSLGTPEGADTDEILLAMGYSKEKIAELRKMQAVR